ncbi:efflux RND transporter periplasmic adaptor subunit [Thalassomonas actiniarum]|uniref:Efflux RND transporter periplasmic adaptor subunit n=1 Tax=Thalassomonas actiniarum TaxID=485447 RepID=A0AAE9YNI1_9GAMM|nr:efflux RND transporter periplasmic adaptor subunit [Thalassomonas actiniarum]WDD96692.1 efflux RND transporter periplasmic adaptor subunit [Thalassomonas actiniarum]
MEINLLTSKQHHFPGEVKASKQALLAFRVPGEILKYHVVSGQQVSQDQLLVELDPVEYQLLVNARQANFELARVQYRRAAVLVKDFLISQEDFDNAKTALQVAESALKTAQANLSYTKFYAPYSGVVAATYKQNYEYVNAQQPVLSFQSVNAIDIEIAVPERLMTALRKQTNAGARQQAQIAFAVDASKKYPASLKNIGTVADPDTGSYKVKLTMAQPKEITLYPGMAAMASTSLQLADNELNARIPASAIVSEGEQRFVWRINQEQTLEKAYITLAANNQLTSGLDDGDIIVTAGAGELTPGQKVKKWQKERGL